MIAVATFLAVVAVTSYAQAAWEWPRTVWLAVGEVAVWMFAGELTRVWEPHSVGRICGIVVAALPIVIVAHEVGRWVARRSR